ncbi:MAG TPA: hypothetical protein DEQ43_25810, partial [Nocardioides bacterium]|nr:hypothetical protein [Nocardioides sp.]
CLPTSGRSCTGRIGWTLTRPASPVGTFGRWQVRQPFPGIYLWRDPHGVYYLIDHTEPPAPRRGLTQASAVRIGRKCSDFE